jgi:hypothetical protein
MNSFLRHLLLPVAFVIPLAVHAETSMLRVACEGDDVGAEVSVNGKFKGECPLDMQVAPGTLKLRVVKAERQFEKEIRIGDGVVKKIAVVMELNEAARKIEDERLAIERQRSEEQRKKYEEQHERELVQQNIENEKRAKLAKAEDLANRKQGNLLCRNACERTSTGFLGSIDRDKLGACWETCNQRFGSDSAPSIAEMFTRLMPGIPR